MTTRMDVSSSLGAARMMSNRKEWTVCGIKNYGNNCFMNVVLHLMASSPTFFRFLNRIVSAYDDCLKSNLIERDEIAFLRELRDLIDQLSCRLQVAHFIHPLKFLEMVTERFPHLHTSQQQDAQEAFHIICEAVRVDSSHAWEVITRCRLRPKPTSGLHILSTNHKNNNDKFQLPRHIHALSPPSRQVFSSNPFEGRLRSHLRCGRCGKEKPNRDTPFLDMSVTLPRACWNNSSITAQLTECLITFLCDELSDVRCESCNHISNFGQFNRFSSPPPMLCIHINRLVRGLHKLVNHVVLPSVLDISRLCEPDVVAKQGQVEYQLKCVVEHLGSSRGGHYQTFRHITYPNPVGMQHAVVTPEASNHAMNAIAQRMAVCRGFHKITPPTASCASPSPSSSSSSVSGFQFGENSRLSANIQQNTQQQQQQFRHDQTQSVGKQLAEHWMLLSDESVSRATESHVASAGAFMICYERVISS
eukprot:c5342_g1_i1.p1 GENE.c5342_g1_i1~~c5342_g1_i1.p1  ORF type:complete len:519 (+),score=105.89 c5342_g1_i1:135-1559(+)